MTTKAESLEGLIGVRSAQKIDNNTFQIQFEDGREVIRFHHTNVVTRMPSGSVILHSGGWKTPTTKDRINKYGTVRIYQDNSQWYFDRQGDRYLFEDGTVLHKDGRVEGAIKHDPKADKIKQADFKKIKAYAEGFVQALSAGKIPYPGPGDCWFCSMKMPSMDHFKSHFQEKYYVPSLLANAVSRFPVSTAAHGWIANCMAGKNNAGWLGDIGREQVKKSIARYLKEQLGYAA